MVLEFVNVVVYLDGNNVSAIHGLHVVRAGGELSGLVELPGLVERTEGAVDGGNTGRRRAEGRVHHHILSDTNMQLKRLGSAQSALF